MHKKLEAKIVNLAHSILQMKNRDDIEALKEKARILYERLSVLAFVDEYIEATPNATQSKEVIISKLESVIENKPEEIIENDIQEEENLIENKVKEISQEPSLKIPKKNIVKNIIEETVDVIEGDKKIDDEQIQQEEVTIDFAAAVEKEIIKTTTIEEEFKDSVSADVTTNLFTKVETKTSTKKLSLNDKLQSNLQVGLNDRIAFVKHLFNHSQADFNRVISQLNSFKAEEEALNFIDKMVKPDYDWTGKEEFEERFLELITRKFL